jgi:cob(I)alamin adenosyltransferase
MKIYTRKGDDGTTGLFGGARISKGSLRVRAYGEVDELNSAIGVARVEVSACAPAADPDGLVDGLLGDIQSRLFDVGAELACLPGREDKLGIPLVTDDDVAVLEQAIDRAETELEPLRAFVLPGGTRASAAMHVARTVCRRAERSIVELGVEEPVRPEVIRYVNRLSDLLFTLARLLNRRAGVADVPWVGRGKRG